MLIKLLENFSISQIILFLILAAIAFKEVIDFIDWISTKIKNRDKNTLHENVENQAKDERINQIEKNVQLMTYSVDQLTKKVDILIDSDKDDIKAWITKEHHNFVYDKGWIDDYSLDCLEKRYSHYVEENGNSFILDLMKEVRALPKKPPTK